MAKSTSIDLYQPQLFLDDRGLADTFRVHRQWHQPRKFPRAVLTADHPWEAHCPTAYGTVLRREGKFHLWYCGWTRQMPPRVLYAVSDDGVTWTKPALGLVNFQGSPANNIVLEADKPGHLIDDLTVIEDDGDAKWPLKMLYWDGGHRGICLARSADGIHWDKQGVVLPQWGDRFNAVPSRYRGEFILLGRTPDYWPAHRLRAVHRTASRDLKRWSKPTLAMKPDLEDPAEMETYSCTAFPYAGRLLGSIERMHMTPDRLDSELIWSDDAGVTWQRSRQRQPFIPLGPQGHFDDTWCNLTANAPIVVKNELWFYYSGRTGAHGAQFPHNHGGIGLATLRRDGFCSLFARNVPGYVVTEPMTWPDADLLINADCRRDLTSHPYNHSSSSRIHIEVQDAAGEPIKGFALADHNGYGGNTLARSVGDGYAGILWQQTRSIRRLRGRKVRLKFQIADSHLYAWKAGDAPKMPR
jgi:hypothetical protein